MFNNVLLVVIIGMISSSSTIRLVSSQEPCQTEFDASTSCLTSSCIGSCTVDDFTMISDAATSATNTNTTDGYCSSAITSACVLKKCCKRCSAPIDNYFTCLSKTTNETKCSLDCDTVNTDSGKSGGSTTFLYSASSFPTILAGILVVATTISIQTGVSF